MPIVNNIRLYNLKASQHVALHLLQKAAYVPDGQLARRAVGAKHCALHRACHVQTRDLDALEGLDCFELTVALDYAIGVCEHYEGSQAVAFVLESVHCAEMGILDVELVSVDGFFSEMALR